MITNQTASEVENDPATPELPVSRRVLKVKRNAKGFVTVMYEADTGSGFTDRYSMQCKSEPHPDLLNAFQELRQHVKEICEFDDNYMEKVTVSGVSFTYKETEHGLVQGAVITAQKLLKNHPAPMIINTPHKTDAPYSESGDDSACFSTSAAMSLWNVTTEALAFVDGKRGKAPAEDDALMETEDD